MFIVDVRIGGINMGFIKNLFDKDEVQTGNGNEYYDIDKLKEEQLSNIAKLALKKINYK